MNDNVLSWVLALQGQTLRAPQGDGGQCVDLAALWVRHRSLPRIWADAAEWFTHFDPTHFQRVPNAPHNYPPAGALVVWGWSLRAGTGPSGHIALAVDANPSYLITFDQNWPTGSGAHLQLHDYTGVLGWLVELPTTATPKSV